jgi:hypothetical protein
MKTVSEFELSLVVVIKALNGMDLIVGASALDEWACL